MSVLRWHPHAKADLICLIEQSHSRKGRNQIIEKPPKHQKTAGFEIVFYFKQSAPAFLGIKSNLHFQLLLFGLRPLFRSGVGLLASKRHGVGCAN